MNIPREKAAGERLKNKVCVVSGGSKGMGRAFCQALAAEGAKVAVLARQSNELETIVQEIGSNAKSVACDVSNPESIDTAFTTILETFGRIDSVISNAAITSLLKIETASISEVQQDIAVNFLGPVFLTRAAIPHLRAAGGGDMIYVSSESVRMPYPYLSLYAAAKGGTEVFAAGMRNELRDQHTRVTVLRSGAVGGTNIEESWDPTTREEFFKSCAHMGNTEFTGKPASKETMANALIALLCLPNDVNVDLIEIRGR